MKKRHHLKTKNNWILPILCFNNKKVLKTTIALKTISKTSAYFYRNKEHYCDFLQFNFGNTECLAEPVKTVNYRNVPLEESKKLKNLYKHFIFLDEKEIFNRLGTVPTILNTSCPIEAKWVYEYVKKFKTKKYNPENKVTVQEILRPINKLELQAYIKITE